MSDTSTHLIDRLEQEGADFALIDHPAEGATEAVSAMRGHRVEQASKCILLMVKLDKRTKRHVLAVVPGDRRVDLDAIRTLHHARYVGFCDDDTAETLARTIPGTVLPFPMDPTVDLLVDPLVLEQPRLYFNAARLDRSVSLATSDYQRIARPRVTPIVQTSP